MNGPCGVGKQWWRIIKGSSGWLTIIHIIIWYTIILYTPVWMYDKWWVVSILIKGPGTLDLGPNTQYLMILLLTLFNKLPPGTQDQCVGPLTCSDSTVSSGFLPSSSFMNVCLGPTLLLVSFLHRIYPFKDSFQLRVNNDCKANGIMMRPM